MSELDKNSESLKEGFLDKLFNSFMIKQKDCGNEYTNNELVLIKEYHNYLRANGEKPEVVNPVTQTQLEQEVTDYLTNNNIHYRIIHNTIDIIKGNLNRIQMSKVVEATKEQPICECCKTNKSSGIREKNYSRELFCNNCWETIKGIQ